MYGKYIYEGSYVQASYISSMTSSGLVTVTITAAVTISISSTVTVSISGAVVTISVWNSSSVVDEVDITEVAVVVVSTMGVVAKSGVT